MQITYSSYKMSDTGMMTSWKHNEFKKINPNQN